MSEQYVPTMGQIRDGYVWLSGGDNPGAEEAAGDDFDTAIAAHDREVKAEAMEDEERFCHLCCAGLESSQHNTDCIGSDNGLAAHDREVEVRTLREAAGDVVDECSRSSAECFCGSDSWLRDRADRIEKEADQ